MKGASKWNLIFENWFLKGSDWLVQFDSRHKVEHHFKIWIYVSGLQLDVLLIIGRENEELGPMTSSPAGQGEAEQPDICH